MDGDLLLHITDEDLKTDLGMNAGLTRKRQVVKTFSLKDLHKSKTTLKMAFVFFDPPGS